MITHTLRAILHNRLLWGVAKGPLLQLLMEMRLMFDDVGPMLDAAIEAVLTNDRDGVEVFFDQIDPMLTRVDAIESKFSEQLASAVQALRSLRGRG